MASMWEILAAGAGKTMLDMAPVATQYVQDRRDARNSAAFQSELERILRGQAAPAAPGALPAAAPPVAAGAFPLPEAETPPWRPPMAAPAGPLSAPQASPVGAAAGTDAESLLTGRPRRAVTGENLRDILLLSGKYPSSRNKDVLAGLSDIFKAESSEDRLAALENLRYGEGGTRRGFEGEKRDFTAEQKRLDREASLQRARENNNRALQVAQFAQKARTGAAAITTPEEADAQIAYLQSLLAEIVVPNPADYKSASNDLFDPEQNMLAQRFRADYARAMQSQRDVEEVIRTMEQRKIQLGGGAGAPATPFPTSPAPGGAGGKVLDDATAAQYLQRAGGDKARARQMATQDGYLIR